MEAQAKDIWKAPVEVEQERSREEDFSEYLEDLFMWLLWSRSWSKAKMDKAKGQDGRLGQKKINLGLEEIKLKMAVPQL